MTRVDAHVTVRQRANEIAGTVHGKDVSEPEVWPPISPLRISRRLERRHQRTAAADERTDAVARLVGQIGGVRHDQDPVRGQSPGAEIVFVHEIEEDPSLEQRVVHPLQVLRRLRAIEWPTSFHRVSSGAPPSQ